MLFDVKYMDLNLNIENKFDVIYHLANLASDRLTNVEKYIEDVRKRENISTTGIGEGVAIPHAKSDFVKEPTVIVGKSKNGIKWESIDDIDVNIIFLIAVPNGVGDEHLKIIQKLAVSLMDEDFKSNILDLNDENEIVKLLLDKIV